MRVDHTIREDDHVSFKRRSLGAEVWATGIVRHVGATVAVVEVDHDHPLARAGTEVTVALLEHIRKLTD